MYRLSIRSYYKSPVTVFDDRDEKTVKFFSIVLHMLEWISQCMQWHRQTVDISIPSYPITLFGSNLKHPVVRSWLCLSMDRRNIDEIAFIYRFWNWVVRSTSAASVQQLWSEHLRCSWPMLQSSWGSSPLPTMQSQLHVVDSCIFACALLFISITGCFFLTVHLVLTSAFIQYRGLNVLTANLRESLSVPGCQYCLTCAFMADKS